MIIKSKSHKTKKAFKTVVAYILRERDKENGFVLSRFIKDKNAIPMEISEQFLENEKYRLNPRKNNVTLYHEILSWHPENAKDLNNHKLKRMALKYMKLRSTLSMCLAAVHRDTKSTHIHFVFSGTRYKTGQSIRISRSDFRDKVKVPMERYQEQRYPELSKSKVNHVKKNRLNEI